jgi:hypothetical protein
MAEESGWGVDVKSCSDKELVSIIQQLRGSRHLAIQLAAQRELVNRLRIKRGLNTSQIVSVLTSGAGKKERAEIAREWASVLELSEMEFRRLASGGSI